MRSFGKQPPGSVSPARPAQRPGVCTGPTTSGTFPPARAAGWTEGEAVSGNVLCSAALCHPGELWRASLPLLLQQPLHPLRGVRTHPLVSARWSLKDAEEERDCLPQQQQGRTWLGAGEGQKGSSWRSQCWPGATEPCRQPCSRISTHHHRHLLHLCKAELAGEQSDLSLIFLALRSTELHQRQQGLCCHGAPGPVASSAAQMAPLPKACRRGHQPNESSLGTSEQLGKLSGAEHPGYPALGGSGL